LRKCPIPVLEPGYGSENWTVNFARWVSPDIGNIIDINGKLIRGKNHAIVFNWWMDVGSIMRGLSIRSRAEPSMAKEKLIDRSPF
jgi:hypothetical protein